ncbi:cupin domain-containing protein [Methanolobus sediminis]|uniref:Cupin domain-containing protein n=1 Tax=Methanolobus sediminis TaxID=3072978 RepID=A0AA51ULS8_9EURY|nr:cupin domain-containing protein [Methanolobus sediminis]WMW25622.1 cupin domain-containing protein [Methanolobus sediminis]
MISIRKIIFAISLSILLLMVAGCVQTDGSGISDQNENVSSVGEQGTDINTSGQDSLQSVMTSTESLVNDAIALMDKQGTDTFDEFRQADSKWFHDDTYLSIWTIDGIRTVYAPNVSSEGEDASGLKDYNGNPLGQLFIDTATSEEGEGWVTYQWPKPGETVPSMKYTFVKKASIGDQEYLVTSGFYVDDYVYTNSLDDIEYFTRFDTVSLGNLLHPSNVDHDLGIDYSIAHVIIKSGASIEAHIMKNPETYYVISGEGVLYIDNVPFDVKAGDLVVIPANAVQSIENTGDADLEFFAIDQPAWAEENEVIVE